MLNPIGYLSLIIGDPTLKYYMFIRAVYKTQKKKIKADDKPNYEFLMKELVRCFGDAVRTAEIGYYDEDKEFIRITCDDDWDICMEEAQIKNKDRHVTNIEVHILPSEHSYEALSHSKSEISKSFVEAPLLETTKSDFQDWKLIERDEPKEPEALSTEPILQVSQSLPTEPSIFEDPIIEPEVNLQDAIMDSMKDIPRFTNQSTEDILVDIKLSGTPADLEKIQHTIVHKFAPHAGFEIDSCQILTKRNQPEEVIAENDDTDSILDNQSQMSQLSTQMRDEIESLIEEKLRKLSLFNHQEVSFSKKKEAKRISSGNYNHFGVTCDNCHKEIVGCARFKSLVHRDYDLCESCEATGIHSGPMIKIRDPIGRNKGMKLNSEFEYLSGLFKDAPIVEKKSVESTNFSPRLSLKERLQKATRVMEESVKTPSKMDTETISEKPRSQLCHIRRSAPKPEEKKEEKIEQVEKPMQEEKIEKKEAPVDIQLTEAEIQLFRMFSRMFPHHEATSLKTFIKANTGLTNEEILNKFLDTMMQN